MKILFLVSCREIAILLGKNVVCRRPNQVFREGIQLEAGSLTDGRVVILWIIDPIEKDPSGF